MSIAEAAATDDRRATLVAMRDKLAADMDEAPAAVVAQIAGRLAAILEDIELMSDDREVSPFDELMRRRADRIAASEGGKSSERSG